MVKLGTEATVIPDLFFANKSLFPDAIVGAFVDLTTPIKIDKNADLPQST
jgi:uncharacterized protein (DUF3820 family)